MSEPSSSLLADRVIAFIRAQGRPAWLVGGFVRDLLLARPRHDLDVLVTEGGVRLARAIGAAFGGASFVLDDARDVGRAILPDAAGARLEVDVARLRMPELLDDLALRDFTVNAMALDISAADPARGIFDPFDGRADVARNLLRAVTEGTFRDDPLRMLRGLRMTAELGFRLEDATFNLIRRDAALIQTVAPERVHDELIRILAAPGAWRRLRTLESLGLLRHVLPEAAAQAGVTQSAPHYQDVFDHTRSVVAHLEGLFAWLWPDSGFTRPAASSGDITVFASAGQWEAVAAALAPFAERLRQHLAQPLASGHTRRDLLPWAALAHDWGKPAKRSVDEAGVTHFYDHDRWGALLAEARLQALRFSSEEVTYVARLTDAHMRPGLLAHDFPPTRRALYRFYRDVGTIGPDCAVLALADTLAIQAAADLGALPRHLDMTERLLAAFFDERTQQVDPPPLLNGRQIMAEFGLPPGPRLGALLEGLREAQGAGEVFTVEDAWTWARAHLG